MLLPSSYNYIACLLTLRCNYKCSYCLNWRLNKSEKNVDFWVEALNKIETDLSITLSGGEPSIHTAFFPILTNIDKKFDILTNLTFDIDRFIKEVPVSRFNNDKTFAPIRVSFHPEFSNIEEIKYKVRKLQYNGYRVGVYMVETPETVGYKQYFNDTDIDFQIKPLLPSNIRVSQQRYCSCRINELIIGPDGNVYKCHRDLYKSENPIGNPLEIQEIEYKFRECYNSNECHPCDTKIKRDRFGNENYCSVKKRTSI